MYLILTFNFLTLKMTQVCIITKVTSDYQLMVVEVCVLAVLLCQAWGMLHCM